MAISAVNPYNYYNSSLYTGASPYPTGRLIAYPGSAGTSAAASTGNDAATALDSFYQALNPTAQLNKSVYQYVADIKKGASDILSAWKGLGSAYGAQSAYRAPASAVGETADEADTEPLSAVAEKALALVDGYNSLLAAAERNAGARGADKLSAELSGMAHTYAASLSRIGITADKNGYLTLQKSTAEAAAADGRMESFFTGNSGQSFGFGNRLSRLAQGITRSPSQYVAGVAFNQTIAATQNISPSIINYLNSGLIFNALV